MNKQNLSTVTNKTIKKSFLSKKDTLHILGNPFVLYSENYESRSFFGIWSDKSCILSGQLFMYLMICKSLFYTAKCWYKHKELRFNTSYRPNICWFPSFHTNSATHIYFFCICIIDFTQQKQLFFIITIIYLLMSWNILFTLTIFNIFSEYLIVQ